MRANYLKQQISRLWHLSRSSRLAQEVSMEEYHRISRGLEAKPPTAAAFHELPGLESVLMFGTRPSTALAFDFIWTTRICLQPLVDRAKALVILARLNPDDTDSKGATGGERIMQVWAQVPQRPRGAIRKRALVSPRDGAKRSLSSRSGLPAPSGSIGD